MPLILFTKIYLQSVVESFGDRLWTGEPMAVLVAVVLYILYQLLPVIELVVIATLIAIILRTLLSWVQKVVKVRWLSVVILVTLLDEFLAQNPDSLEVVKTTI